MSWPPMKRVLLLTHNHLLRINSLPMPWFPWTELISTKNLIMIYPDRLWKGIFHWHTNHCRGSTTHLSLGYLKYDNSLYNVFWLDILVALKRGLFLTHRSLLRINNPPMLWLLQIWLIDKNSQQWCILAVYEDGYLVNTQTPGVDQKSAYAKVASYVIGLYTRADDDISWLSIKIYLSLKHKPLPRINNLPMHWLSQI